MLTKQDLLYFIIFLKKYFNSRWVRASDGVTISSFPSQFVAQNGKPHANYVKKTQAFPK